MLQYLRQSKGLPASIKNTADAPFMQVLDKFIASEIINGKQVYPAIDQIFAAFNYCSFKEYKVVIIGQDPYHSPQQANGLAFSVHKDQKVPPSLKNIFKEINNDLAIEIPNNGDLSYWATQRVLLLNSILTVEEALPGSHQKKGWEQFTDHVINAISEELNGVVFMLWGNYAKSKKHLIDDKKHLVLEANHPSPLSAHRGFFNNKHFSKCNIYLISQGKIAIDWKLPL